jgi:hypothetical protein
MDKYSAFAFKITLSSPCFAIGPFRALIWQKLLVNSDSRQGGNAQGDWRQMVTGRIGKCLMEGSENL